MKKNDIKQKIQNVIDKCSDPEIYSNIIQDFFVKGIEKPGDFLNSLKILPKLTEKQLIKNFKKNKEKLCNFINQNNIEKLELYQILSCIFGAFVGDAIGGFCEFLKSSKLNADRIFKEIPIFGQLPGQITDDSEMAMCLAYALMENPEKDKIDPNYIYFFYGAWANSHPIDIGHTTQKAFKDFNFNEFSPKRDNFHIFKDEIAKENNNSLSNGFLMRKTTLIAWIYYKFYGIVNKAFANNNNDNIDLIELYEKAKEISNIDNVTTHPNPETDPVSAFYIIMALGAIKKLPPYKIIDILINLCNDNYFKQKKHKDLKLANNIIFYIDKFKRKNFDFWNYFGEKDSHDSVNKNMGWYEHAFKLTLYYLVNFEKFEKKNLFSTILKDICNLGGDTDTNACIVGGVIGPLIGYKNFGDYFKKVLDVIPRDRYMFSICLMAEYVLYLNNTKRNNINNNCYFLRTILTLLYDDIGIDIEI